MPEPGESEVVTRGGPCRERSEVHPSGAAGGGPVVRRPWLPQSARPVHAGSRAADYGVCDLMTRDLVQNRGFGGAVAAVAE